MRRAARKRGRERVPGGGPARTAKSPTTRAGRPDDGPATVRATQTAPGVASAGLDERMGSSARSRMPRRAAGRKTRNEAPPPSRSSTHARPPWSSANRATSESPIPVPGAWGDAVGPWRNGSKIASRARRAHRARRPRPRSAPPPRSGFDAQPDAAVGVVCRAAFISRFSTMRSTFGGSPRARRARRRPRSMRSASASRLSTRPLARARRCRPLRYCGSTMPRLSRSMSRRSFSRRSSLRAFAESRSSRSSRSSALRSPGSVRG